MKKIIVNGKEYSSLGEVSTDLQDLLKDDNKNGLPDFVENMMNVAKDSHGNHVATATQFIVKGKSYKSINEMPPEVRQEVEEKLKKMGAQPNAMMAGIQPSAGTPSSPDSIQAGTNPRTGMNYQGSIPGVKKDYRNALLILGILAILGWYSYQYFLTK